MPRHRSSITARALDGLLQAAKIAGALTAVLGIPYGVIQYIQKDHQNRVEQSIRFFDKFNSTPMTTYREEINKIVSQHADKLRAAATSPETLEKAVLEMVKDNRNLEAHLWLVMDFFDGVTVCVVNNLCDAETVDQLLAGRARDYYEVFYPYIQSRRGGRNTSKFAIGLETVATAGRRQKQAANR